MRGSRHSSFPPEVDPDPSWRDDAACAAYPIDMWFPTKDAGKHWIELFPGATVRAYAICDRCPVRDRCLEYAVVNRITNGIWGGESERARARRLKRSA